MELDTTEGGFILFVQLIYYGTSCLYFTSNFKSFDLTVVQHLSKLDGIHAKLANVEGFH